MLQSSLHWADLSTVFMFDETECQDATAGCSNASACTGRYGWTEILLIHHHQVAHSNSIAVSRMRRSVARCNAECSPSLSGLRSLSIVRSQDWRGQPLGRHQSTGRRSVDARSTREWSSEAAARAICPNSLRRHCCISEEAGGWLVCDRTNTLVTCAVYGHTPLHTQINAYGHSQNNRLTQ